MASRHDPFNATAASDVHMELQRTGHQIAFAESCTAGLIAASLGRQPGISAWLAGSAVVYQFPTKTVWLGVTEESLQSPGPVSRDVSEQMAAGLLESAPHVTFAASVTGHLGPGAPPAEDGTAWSTVSIRKATGNIIDSRLLLLDDDLADSPNETIRQQRQTNAVRQVLLFCLQRLQDEPDLVSASP